MPSSHESSFGLTVTHLLPDATQDDDEWLGGVRVFLRLPEALRRGGSLGTGSDKTELGDPLRTDLALSL